MKRALTALAVGVALSTAALAESCDWGPGGGYGPGPGGMMGGGAGGMMGGYGQRGNGPGPGYGMGMMGGGMMGEGFYGLDRLDLTAEQREKLGTILRDSRARQWKAMEQMHELAWKDGGLRGDKFDEAAARKLFEAHQQAQKQMFENRLETRKQVEAVLTAEQRDKLGKRAW